MGYQFAHIEAYSRAGSAVRGKSKRLSIRQVIAEALREAGNCDHIANPQTPETLHGDIHALEQEINQCADSMKDNLGRKLRKDKLVLLAGVASYPVRTHALNRDDKDFREWAKLNVDFYKQKWGEQLKGVLVHWDEEFPHLHFYVVPDGLRMSNIHPGVAASENAPKGKARSAYQQAMRSWQNDYYQAVGFKCGLTRSGPGRRRLSRAEWKAEQVVAQLAGQCVMRQQTEITLVAQKERSKISEMFTALVKRLRGQNHILSKQIATLTNEVQRLTHLWEEAQNMLRGAGLLPHLSAHRPKNGPLSNGPKPPGL